MKNIIVGRENEKLTLEGLLKSREAEFCAVFGRRRIGKTFLIREYFSDHNSYFEITGEKEVSLSDQLSNFTFAFKQKFPNTLEQRPGTWREALQQVARQFDAQSGTERIVLFFDELPWLASAKSGFLSALDHFWNTWASKRNVLLIICGSASSWMISKIIHSKGGLYNRVTKQIRLMPFSLSETENYLRSRGITLVRKDIVELYMCLGGVPFYLRQVEKGLSVSQNLEKMCLSPQAILRDEFKYLFASLFDNPEKHTQIIRALASNRQGLTRNKLLSKIAIDSGGSLSKTLSELEQSGFISNDANFGKKTRDSIYRLVDEYSLLYLTWIEKSKAQSDGFWQSQKNSRGFLAWAGFSFEGVCLKHVAQIKKQLGIAGIGTTQYGWICRGKEENAQIDLVIDRADNCINLCEIKFSSQQYAISKSYAEDLRKKNELFVRETKTRKTIFPTMISTFGCVQNDLFTQTIVKEIVVDDLFAAI